MQEVRNSYGGSTRTTRKMKVSTTTSQDNDAAFTDQR
jgi:hypothetical protein